jgi:Fe-coproporphyrin III synthase
MWWRDGLRLAPAVLTSRVRATPYKLLLSLTDHCNLRCGHCHAWRRRTAELTPDELGRTLASLPGLRWLDITGGEPTLRPDLDACVAAITPALQRAVFVHFPTNGWQVDAAAALAIGLRDASPARVVVTVSVDGPEEIHDRLRGREGSYARALETWRRLDGLPGVEVYVGTTVTPENAAALPELAALLPAALPGFDLRHWHVNLQQRSEHFFSNAEAPPLALDEALSALAFIEAQRRLPRDGFALAEWLFLRNLRRHLETGRIPVPCQAGRASVHVAADGVVYPCHVLDESLGDLRDHDFDLPRLLGTAQALRGVAGLRDCSHCWTPCEAYHALLASPVAALRGALPRSRG